MSPRRKGTDASKIELVGEEVKTHSKLPAFVEELPFTD
jgi:hypothetical protein